ncbi:MAG: hypothetical protein HUJ25_07630 [Crocinitomicaceae bacterium]|nr:hypothetical protein [Crocinitomicaceae bacterium]
MKHKFSITISGSKKEATTKAQALGTLAAYLDTQTLETLANVVKNDPDKVALAKQFLGL